MESHTVALCLASLTEHLFLSSLPIAVALFMASAWAWMDHIVFSWWAFWLFHSLVVNHAAMNIRPQVFALMYFET